MNNLVEIANGLEKAGYVAQHNVVDDVIIVKLDCGDGRGRIPAVLMIEDGRLSITAQICTLGELLEENLVLFAMAALDANSRISPFAFSLITERDDESITDSSDYVVILIDHIPISGEAVFGQSELESAMQSLINAIAGSREVVQAGFIETSEC